MPCCGHVACINLTGVGIGRLGIFPADYAKPLFSLERDQLCQWRYFSLRAA
jgi:hypothetical protein